MSKMFCLRVALAVASTAAAMLPKQTKGNSQKFVYKTFIQPAVPRCTKNRKRSLKHHMKYFHFRRKIQLDHHLKEDHRAPGRRLRAQPVRGRAHCGEKDSERERRLRRHGYFSRDGRGNRHPVEHRAQRGNAGRSCQASHFGLELMCRCARVKVARFCPIKIYYLCKRADLTSG